GAGFAFPVISFRFVFFRFPDFVWCCGRASGVRWPFYFFSLFVFWGSLLDRWCSFWGVGQWRAEDGYSGRVIPTATRARSPPGFPVPNNLQRRESRISQKPKSKEQRAISEAGIWCLQGACAFLLFAVLLSSFAVVWHRGNCLRWCVQGRGRPRPWMAEASVQGCIHSVSRP